MTRLAHLALIDARHAAVMAGYWIRPYDPHLDARRWRWQRSGRQRSYDALAALTEQQRQDLVQAARRKFTVPTCPGCSSPLCPDCAR